MRRLPGILLLVGMTFSLAGLLIGMYLTLPSERWLTSLLGWWFFLASLIVAVALSWAVSRFAHGWSSHILQALIFSLLISPCYWIWLGWVPAALHVILTIWVLCQEPELNNSTLHFMFVEHYINWLSPLLVFIFVLCAARLRYLRRDRSLN